MSTPVLVDTSVWVDFLRQGNELLAELLNQSAVVTHPCIIGELHVGNLSKRQVVLGLLDKLPRAKTCTHEEVLAFIESRKLYGKGLGYMDVHILSSALLSDLPLWTLDKRLDRVAKALR